MAAALNCLVGGELDPGRAEVLVTGSKQAHHVRDDTGGLGLPPEGGTPLRVALGRVAATASPDQVWQVVSAFPGRTGGLRGPSELTRLAIDHGAVVVPVTGGQAWVPLVLGTQDEIRAVQWLLVPADRPIPAPTPGEAHDALRQAMAATEHGMPTTISVAPPPRPAAATLELPPGYPGSSQRLVATATQLAAASAWARDHAAGTSSFELSGAEHLLHDLYFAAVAAVDAAVSWPQRALRE